jgi:succinyl-CoA synthetase alpha subunit
MGHAGAIISGGNDTAEAKISALQEAGVTMVQTTSDIGAAVKRILG